MPERTFKPSACDRLCDDRLQYQIMYGFDSVRGYEAVIGLIHEVGESLSDPRSIDALSKTYRYAIASWISHNGETRGESLYLMSSIEEVVTQNAGKIARHITGEYTKPAEQHALGLLVNVVQHSIVHGEEYSRMISVLERKWSTIRLGYEAGYGSHEAMMYQFLDDTFSQKVQRKSKSAITEHLEKGYLEADFDMLAHTWVHGTETQVAHCTDLLTAFLAPRSKGIPIFSKGLARWIDIELEEEDGDVSRRDIITKNLAVVAQLTHYHPDALQVLYHGFGISHFGRYPTEFLTEMFDDLIKGDSRPYVFLIDGMTDWNGSFYIDRETPFIQSMKHDLAQQGYALRIVEVSEVEQGMSTIHGLTGRFGKASGAIVRAHGNSTSISFTRKRDNSQTVYHLTSRMLSSRFRYITPDGTWSHINGKETGEAFLSHNFHAGSQFLFRGCRAAHITNLMGILAHSYSVTASNSDCIIYQPIRFDKNEDGSLQMSADYLEL